MLHRKCLTIGQHFKSYFVAGQHFQAQEMLENNIVSVLPILLLIKYNYFYVIKLSTLIYIYRFFASLKFLQFSKFLDLKKKLITLTIL